MRRLLASGWWVAVVGAGLTLAVTVLELRPPAVSRRPAGDGRSVASYRFDLGTCLVPRDRIVAAGMPRDGLPALDEPRLLPATEVDRRNREGRGKFLLDDDRVIGVAVADDARAYPLRFMSWHEVVNDTVGGTPVVITYNPLSDAVVVARRDIGGETLRFGVSGLLYESNLLLYDRRDRPERSSLFSQLQARAIAGPAATGRIELELLPAAVSSWGAWRAVHPATRVLAPLPRLRELYQRDPYSSYFGSELLRFPVDPLPPSGPLRLKDRVLVVSVLGRDAVFGLPLLAAATGRERGSFATAVAGVPITIDFDAALGTAVVTTPGSNPEDLATRFACWFAWYATHPDTPTPLPEPLPRGSTEELTGGNAVVDPRGRGSM